MDAAQSNSSPVNRDGSIRVLDFAVIVVELGLVLLLLRQYQIENSAGFLLIAQLAFGGFLIHAWLPLRLRLPFFALLSLAGTAMLLGAANFAWMLALGLALIGICHL